MSTSASRQSTIEKDRRFRMLAVISLVLITIAGFYLRIRCLGCLGFRGDEDLTSLAVKSLIENGIPLLPSGMIYPRFYIYQWILALTVGELGFSEFSIRLPGVVFGTMLIPAGYWVTSRMFGRTAGIVVAAGIAFSFTQVEMARAARMYAPFFLVYLLAAFSIYRAYFENTERTFSPWPLLMCALALSFHQLAYSLAVFFLLAIPLRPTAARAASLFAQSATVGAAFLVIKSVQSGYFNRARRLARESAAGTDQAGTDGSLIESIVQQVSFPSFELIAQVPVWVMLVLVILFVLGIARLRPALRDETTAFRILAFLSLTLSFCHQFNLAIITLAIMMIVKGSGIDCLRLAAWYRPALACLVLFVAWALAIILPGAIDLPGGERSMRQSLRLLVDYPNYRLFWSFIIEYPLLAAPLLLGTLWGVDQVSVKRDSPAAWFLVGGLWTGLFLNGIIDTKFEFFRYNMHFYVFFLILSVTGIVELPGLLARLGLRVPAVLESSAGRYRLTGLMAVLVLLAVNPAAALLTSDRDYSEPGRLYRMFGLDVYTDFATPGAYVRERLRPADRLFVIDPREYWNYVGRVDYWIYSDNYQSQSFESGGRYYDLYLGVPVLHDIDDVVSAMSSSAEGDAWLLYSRARLARTRWISAPLKELFRNLEDHVVYTGRDQQTIVIRIPPDHPIRRSGE